MKNKRDQINVWENEGGSIAPSDLMARAGGLDYTQPTNQEAVTDSEYQALETLNANEGNGGYN